MRDFSAVAVRRMFVGWKVADSRRTVDVFSDTSESKPPMTPASATGVSASAMTSISVVSGCSTPSNMTSFSPFRARRTTILPPRSLAKSNGCSGCPSSSIT